MATSEKQKFRAGAGTGTIRFPEELFPLEGFCQVHDDPHARVLLLGGNELAAIVSIELVFTPKEVIQHCKERLQRTFGISPERVWVHTTHVISTPHAPEGEKRGLFLEAVYAAVDEAVAGAEATLQHARIGVGLCISDLIENRDIMTPDGPWIGRNGYGPTNKLLTLLRFESMNHQPIAFLINYALKPSVLDNAGMERRERQVSSDAPGYACTVLEGALHAPTLFATSAAGDQIPRETALYYELQEDGSLVLRDLGVEAGFAMVKRLGSELAVDVLKIAENIQCVVLDRPVHLVQRQFLWKTKRPVEMKPQHRIDYVEGPESPITVSVMRIGPLMLVACKPEINCITELHLRARCLSKYTLFFSMVDGGMKYMPDSKSYVDNTWEAMRSRFMPGAAEKFVQVAADLSRELSMVDAVR